MPRVTGGGQPSEVLDFHLRGMETAAYAWMLNFDQSKSPLIFLAAGPRVRSMRLESDKS